MTNETKQEILISLKKARSHLDNIISMLEKDEYCISIMQQNLAVIGLLKSAHSKLMENHLNTCFSKAIESQNQEKKDQMVEEILKVTKIYNK